MGTFQKFCLRWNNHTANLVGTLGHVLASQQHSDVTLCCQGEVWRLHKLVLCASSSHLEQLLAGAGSGHPILVLDGPHPRDVAALVHFMYHGEVNVDQDNLASLLRTAETLKVKGLAEVSSVAGQDHKAACDADRQRGAPRGRSRPSSRGGGAVYSLGHEYPLGMYSLVAQALSPHHVPDPLERDPSPLNLSFSSTLKNIHDETPQERQERRNRLDDLLYAATERSKKEERREARREAREAALREAAAVRDSSVIIPNDAALVPPPKRARTAEPTRHATLPAHPAFHIPLVNLTVPPGGATTLAAPGHTAPSHAAPSHVTQSHVAPSHATQEEVTQQQHILQSEEQHEAMDGLTEGETSVIKTPIKCEKIEVTSHDPLEDPGLSDESETQSAPETPSDLSLATHRPHTPSATPSATPTATPSTPPTDTRPHDPRTPEAHTTQESGSHTPGHTPGGHTTSRNEGGEDEKVAPYFHSLLRQVAEGGAEATPATQAQRVTINMRTFKEEWRRQLLVDYDPRSNMSICMLCFTTFKSYDGPRKNTYVKHAKRFHPSLEEYSEEERDLIIGMYEKYHKYDVDMQKEVNKSYRAANAIVALGKKGARHSELAAGTNGLTKPDPDDKPDLDLTPTKDEDGANTPGKSRSHTPDSEMSVEASEKLSESFDGEEVRGGLGRVEEARGSVVRSEEGRGGLVKVDDGRGMVGKGDEGRGEDGRGGEKIENNNIPVPSQLNKPVATRAKGATAAVTV